MSVRWNEQKQLWQIRIGTSKIIQEGPDRDWIDIWAKSYAKGMNLEVKIVAPLESNFFPQED